MKTFKLERATDISGVSGTGTVAQGVEFDDGSVALRWNGEWPTSVVFHDRGLVSVKAIHGHSGATSIVLDTAGDRLRRLVDAVRAPLLAELAEAAEWAKSARDFRERQIGDLRAEVERLTRERNLWQRTASDIELMVTVLTRERDEWKAARDECERQFQKQVDEVAAQMDRADTAERERDEARAKTDGGEWQWGVHVVVPKSYGPHDEGFEGYERDEWWGTEAEARRWLHTPRQGLVHLSLIRRRPTKPAGPVEPVTDDRASGGQVTSDPRPADSVAVLLSPGRQIVDPDEAEALGLTVDAARLRAVEPVTDDGRGT